MKRLEGITAIVTGAARGIGRAVARRFAEEGARVYAADILVDELNQSVTELQISGFQTQALAVDLRDAASVSSLAETVLQAESRIDVLANVAGVIMLKDIQETSVDDWDYILDINLRGPFLLSKAVVPVMKAQGSGSIMTVSSRAGVVGEARELAYCASKFGVEGFSRALAKDLGDFNIAVNTITPGIPTQTAMSETTYDIATRKIWKDPYLITAAFVRLASSNPEDIHDQYVNAWQLSEALRQEGWH